MTHLDARALDIAPPASGSDAGGGPGTPGVLSELMVEVFITRGAHHHGDVREAADELRDLLGSFGILTEENAAMIEGRATRVARRLERAARARALVDAALAA